MMPRMSLAPFHLNHYASARKTKDVITINGIKYVAVKPLLANMRERASDCGNPPNAVDKGYMLAVTHLENEIAALED